MKRRLISGLLVGIFASALVQLPAASAPPAHLSAVDASEIAASYMRLTGEYYKAITPQEILNSVHTELGARLKESNVKGTIPSPRASEDASSNVHAIDLEVEAAQRAAGSKIGGHDLSYSAISGIMKSANDRYTVFLTPKEYAALNQGLDGGDFGGTGIVIQLDDQSKFISVSNVVPGGPADRAGIQQDDLITAIDGVTTKAMPINAASSHLRGKEGTTVTLSIMRDGKLLPSPVTLTRAKIHQMSVYDKLLPNKIGYVALTVFGKDTGAELATALDRLQQRGARAIVMDLRGNGGGYLDAAVAVSSKFISTGPIVSVESRASNITTLEADNTAIAPMPLAVLVNGMTASASEITSGAIQDSGVGAIIGTKTFGKGVVQTIYPLPDGSAVKITTARYLTPRNRDINHLGITPDIVLDENKGARFGDPTRDTQLQRAVQYLGDRLAHQGGANGV